MMGVPRTAFAVRHEANERMGETVRGFRAVQVRDYIRERVTFPTYGELMREFDFYDRAGAYRVVKRLKDNGTI